MFQPIAKRSSANPSKREITFETQWGITALRLCLKLIFLVTNCDFDPRKHFVVLCVVVMTGSC